MQSDLSNVRCVVFDYGFTLSSELYFTAVPPAVPQWRELIQRLIFDHDDITGPWMCGEIGLDDIAAILAPEMAMTKDDVLGYLRRGCTDLGFNAAVIDFARRVQSGPLKSALVTANMDVFSDVVVPSHGLDRLFDVIVNSADVGTCNKSVLWRVAFAALGAGISYHNSLLIEDGAANPATFRAQGGVAHQYVGDQVFRDWLRSVDFGGSG